MTLGTGTKDQYVQEGNFVYTKDKTILVFSNSTATGSYTLPTTVTELYEGAFAYTGLTSVTLHSGIKELPAYAFLNCAALTRVAGTDGLESLGYGAFAGCASLKTFRIPQGITGIYRQTFAGSALETVVIPDTLEYVDWQAFDDCPLKDVYYSGSEDDWNWIDIYEDGNEPLLEATIHFNAETIPGDVDGNFAKNTDDAVYLLLSVMFGEEDYPVPAGMELDFDGSGKVDTDDAVYLLLHVMFGAESYPI